MVEINLMQEVDVGNIPGIDLLMNDKKSGDNNDPQKTNKHSGTTIDELELKLNQTQYKQILELKQQTQTKKNRMMDLKITKT